MVWVEGFWQFNVVFFRLCLCSSRCLGAHCSKQSMSVDVWVVWVMTKRKHDFFWQMTIIHCICYELFKKPLMIVLSFCHLCNKYILYCIKHNKIILSSFIFCVCHLWYQKTEIFSFLSKELQLSTYGKALLWGFLYPHGCYDVISGLGSAVCTKLHQPRLRNKDDRPTLCLSIAPPPSLTVLWHCQ